MGDFIHLDVGSMYILSLGILTSATLTARTKPIELELLEPGNKIQWTVMNLNLLLGCVCLQHSYTGTVEPVNGLSWKEREVKKLVARAFPSQVLSCNASTVPRSRAIWTCIVTFASVSRNSRLPLLPTTRLPFTLLCIRLVDHLAL